MKTPLPQGQTPNPRRKNRKAQYLSFPTGAQESKVLYACLVELNSRLHERHRETIELLKNAVGKTERSRLQSSVVRHRVAVSACCNMLASFRGKPATHYSKRSIHHRMAVMAEELEIFSCLKREKDIRSQIDYLNNDFQDATASKVAA